MTSRCQERPGFCCHDPACADKHCEGRPDHDEPAIGYEAARLIQDEGGITYAGDEPRAPLNWTRIGWWAAVIAAIGWAAIVHWG